MVGNDAFTFVKILHGKEDMIVLKKKMGKFTETVFYTTAKKTSSISCMFLFGQPKVPEHLRNLKKS